MTKNKGARPDTQSIRDLRQWICWRSEERDGKPTKIPYSPLTGGKASCTSPDTWAGYLEAVAAYKKGGYDGLGFVFTKEDEFVGVDLDHCLHEAGEINAWAREIIAELDSYTEVSPSGTGVHILLRATLTDGRNRKAPVEIYSHSRYFTVTSKHLEGTPRTIENRQEQILALRRRVFGEPVSANGHETTRSVASSGLSDQEIVMKAAAAENGEKFRRLWDGDTSDYSSVSEADQALCSLLAFWTGPDPDKIDQLFRASGLYREKWEQRADYRERTVHKALEDRTEFYGPPQMVPNNMEGTNTANATNTYFVEHREFLELAEAPPFPVDALPESCRRFVREAAVSLGCAPDLVAVPLLGLLSAAIGNSRQVQLKRGWKESASLFVVVVAEPGDKKTPAQKAALAPLWQAQKRLKREYQEKYEVYEEELRYWETERKVATREGEPAPPKPTEPVLKSVVVDDVTVERLADILDENPRGVTSAQDELSGWVLSMNQYKAGSKGADRQFWLRVWSNATVKVDRKNRKVPAIISEPWVSVVGSIQPEILPELNTGRNDGMTDRFLYSYPEPQHARHTDEVVSAAAERAVQELYEKLMGLKMPELDEEPFPGTVSMTKEAWEVFKETADGLLEEPRAFTFPRRLRGAWSKLEAYLARLSLVLALSRVVESNEREQVEPRDVFAASVLVGYFKAHARRVSAELYGADAMDSLAAALSEFLKEHDGKWEGTATELFEVLSEREVVGLPGSPGKLVAKVLAIAGRLKAVQVKKGWRGKNKVLRLQLPKRGVDSVGSVGKEVPLTDSTNATNASFEDPSEITATIAREPSGTSLPTSDEWEEV